MDAQTVRCMMPPMSSDANATKVQVSVTANGGAVTSAPASYTYYDEPAVQALLQALSPHRPPKTVLATTACFRVMSCEAGVTIDSSSRKGT